MTKTYTDLDRVRIAAAASREAQKFLVVQVQEARKNGATLRTIGEAADLSHEQIRRIVNAD